MWWERCTGGVHRIDAIPVPIIGDYLSFIGWNSIFREKGERRATDEPQYVVFRAAASLARLNLITFVSFPPSANNYCQPGHHHHEYFIQTLTHKTQNNSASQWARRLASSSSVIVMLLIFMSIRFLSFNDPLADHLFQKMMFAPPYVRDYMMQHFCWMEHVSSLR